MAQEDLKTAVERAARGVLPRSRCGGVRGMRDRAIVGYGKMGRLIEQLAPEFGFEVGLEAGRVQQRQLRRHHGGELPRRRRRDRFLHARMPSSRTSNGSRRWASTSVVGTTGWVEGSRPRPASRREERHRPGVEPELLRRRAGLLPPGGGSRAACWRTSPSTEPGRGRSTTTPRKTRPRAHC